MGRGGPVPCSPQPRFCPFFGTWWLWDSSQLRRSPLASREEPVHPPYAAAGATSRDLTVQVPPSVPQPSPALARKALAPSGSVLHTSHHPCLLPLPPGVQSAGRKAVKTKPPLCRQLSSPPGATATEPCHLSPRQTRHLRRALSLSPTLSLDKVFWRDARGRGAIVACAEQKHHLVTALLKPQPERQRGDAGQRVERVADRRYGEEDKVSYKLIIAEARPGLRAREGVLLAPAAPAAVCRAGEPRGTASIPPWPAAPAARPFPQPPLCHPVPFPLAAISLEHRVSHSRLFPLPCWPRFAAWCPMVLPWT